MMECLLSGNPRMKHTAHRPTHSSNCCSNSHTARLSSCAWDCAYAWSRLYCICWLWKSTASAMAIMSISNPGSELMIWLAGLLDGLFGNLLNWGKSALLGNASGGLLGNASDRTTGEMLDWT